MKRIGRGRFGSVFLARRLDADARDETPERVAVKVFPCRQREVSALRRELAALLAIRHPRVPRLHDWSTGGSHAFVAMDHFERGSLAEHLDESARPEEDEVWQLLEDLLDALAVAHQASILHLDVKPSNVLLTDDDRFALSDFGISECARAGAVAPRAKGSPGYRAPEQRDERYAAVDARTDLFGAGATVWAFATGLDLARRRRLFDHVDADSGAALPDLATVRPDLSTSLRWLIAELTRSDPEERPGSVSETLARLHSIAGSAEPPHAAARAGERIVRLAPGELLCAEGEESDSAFLLLRGAVAIERGGRVVARIAREGEIVGELEALIGRTRSASLSADGGAAWVCILNAAQFERLVSEHPGLALRLMRAMAERYGG
ncbi:MAG TPA: serine/threonine-protein kinase [Myxococcota bacterium]|nr:serine/threonine-protein kinase [Myxococcota bacterium]